MFSCPITISASLKDTIAGRFWNDVQNLPDLDILLYSLYSLTGVHKLPVFRVHLYKYHSWQVLELCLDLDILLHRLLHCKIVAAWHLPFPL